MAFAVTDARRPIESESGDGGDDGGGGDDITERGTLS